MYALINTMSALDNYLGTILSLHRTEEAADAANAKIQRTIQRDSGKDRYLPTTIRKIKGSHTKGAMIHRSDIA